MLIIFGANERFGLSKCVIGEEIFLLPEVLHLLERRRATLAMEKGLLTFASANHCILNLTYMNYIDLII